MPLGLFYKRESYNILACHRSYSFLVGMSHIPTADGSYTFRSSVFNASYHSSHGAVTESQHVFIQAGLRPLLNLSPGSLSIFEMGLGSGLNALLAALETVNTSPSIYYHSIETHPMSTEDMGGFHIGEVLDSQQADAIMHDIHNGPWDKPFAIHPQFEFFKERADFLRWTVPSKAFDLVFYDAFAPSTQPELWTLEACDKLHSLLRPEGVLVTYCAQGQFKRNLKFSGFSVESLPGPPGKREMTRATTNK